MKKLWAALGIFIFWALWPVFYIISLRGNTRSRVLVVVGDEFLLVKNWVSLGEWSLPGGGTKKSEQTKSGAVRELEEEVGIVTPESNLVRLGASTRKKNGIKVRAEFYCVEFSEKPQIKRQKLEIQDAHWIPLDRADEYNLGNDTKFALKRYRRPEQSSLL